MNIISTIGLAIVLIGLAASFFGPTVRHFALIQALGAVLMAADSFRAGHHTFSAILGALVGMNLAFWFFYGRLAEGRRP